MLNLPMYHETRSLYIRKGILKLVTWARGSYGDRKVNLRYYDLAPNLLRVFLRMQKLGVSDHWARVLM